MQKLGFIGMGNMALAIVEGFINSGKIDKKNIFAFAPNQEKLKKNAERLGFTPCASLKDLAANVDTVLVACKPYQIKDVLAELGAKVDAGAKVTAGANDESGTEHALSGKTLISVAAGWLFQTYKDILGDSVRIQCIMPNTPAMVAQGVMLFEKDNSLSSEEHAQFAELFGALGIVEELPSNLMGIGGAISGCGPAFVDLFMEAYADAAVKYGISRPTAYKIVAQTVLGSAKLQMATGKHPAVLKDEVCSPNGTTICGVAALEKEGFRNACIASIDAVMNKKKQ